MWPINELYNHDENKKYSYDPKENYNTKMFPW